MTAAIIAAAPVDLSLCTNCGWKVRNPREYHPLVACWIVQATGRDPLPYLRTVAEDMAHVDKLGRFVPARERTQP